jgi:hypothetical protein
MLRFVTYMNMGFVESWFERVKFCKKDWGVKPLSLSLSLSLSNKFRVLHYS